MLPNLMGRYPIEKSLWFLAKNSEKLKAWLLSCENTSRFQLILKVDNCLVSQKEELEYSPLNWRHRLWLAKRLLEKKGGDSNPRQTQASLASFWRRWDKTEEPQRLSRGAPWSLNLGSHRSAKTLKGSDMDLRTITNHLTIVTLLKFLRNSFSKLAIFSFCIPRHYSRLSVNV